MSRRLTKLVAKRAAYDQVMRQYSSRANRTQQPSKSHRLSNARWVSHRWSAEIDSAKSLRIPACWRYGATARFIDRGI